MFYNGNELIRTISTSSSSSSSSADEFISSSVTSKTPSEITIDDIDELCDDKSHVKEVHIQQFAQRVLEFSSQYGSDYSISYTACNITGRPSKFPNYGDFPETFAMRTYGKWWDLAPSRISEIMPQTISEDMSQDFIVIQFEEFVFPTILRIFETYNPGAIVKIWAFTMAEKWICLWKNNKPLETQSDQNIFTLHMKDIKVPTRIFRIEFNHKHLEYFTEIDGVLLDGVKYNSEQTNNSIITISQQFNRSKAEKGPIQRKLESVQFKPVVPDKHQDVLKDFLIKDLENFIAEINSGGGGGGIDVPDDTENAQFTLKNLPCEILLKICSYLDLVSLFRISQTCRKLYGVACDPSLYTEVNLKPYWHIIDSPVLQTLSHRCGYLKKIDLSWCGLFNNLNPSDFKEFIRLCGKQITHLRLNSVKFLNADSLEVVSLICDNLKELSLRNANIRKITGNPLARFQQLERLDLFHADIAEEQIMILLKNNQNLKHINLAFGQVNMDDVSLTISQYNKNIVSIDMWKSHGLSAIGLLALATCSELEEVDFGWCLREEASPGESLKALLKGCRKLKKIFLAAIRGLTDRDLENIANLCPNLEQLDLLGVMGISTEKCYAILCKCEKLQLIDLSFCVHLDNIQIAYWKEIFNVSIKRSFVRSDIDYRSAHLNRNRIE